MKTFRKKLSATGKSMISEPIAKGNEMTLRFITHTNSLVQHRSGSGVLSLQIVQSQEGIKAALCQGKAVIKNIPLNELAHFFTHPTIALRIPTMLIKHKLEAYFATIEKHTDSKVLGIRLIILKDETIKIYTIGTSVIEEVKLEDFI